MRRFVCTVAALSAALLVACGGDDNQGGGSLPAAPAITMEGADIDATHEITDGIAVKVNVTAPGKIDGFGIKIESPVLTDDILTLVGLAREMDLVTAAGSMAEGLKMLGFPTGNEVKGKSALSFDISELIPMIAELNPTLTANHNFILTVTDEKAQKTTKTLKFHLTGAPVVTYNDDADLWANTATLTAMRVPEGAKVQYRVKGSESWNDATPAETDVYSIVPEWESSKNAAELDIHTIKAGTGIFAATTYECRIVKDDKTLATTEFTTSEGDAIPNGDMSGWSMKTWINGGNEFKLTYPNAAGDNFWDSGNNAFLEQYDEQGNPTINTPLCSEENGAAAIKAQLVLGAVFASGNMFTGVFDYQGMSGTAKFGRPYTWTARPRALKVRYQATVGLIDKFGGSDPADEAEFMGKQDQSCIFVAAVNWEGQHGVTSGMVEPSGMWNPADTDKLEEGAILGYGQQIITQSNDTWVELTIPMSWYDKAAKNPSAANYSLVISCATSVRGDYLTGCSTNKMLLDDFEWVY